MIASLDALVNQIHRPLVEAIIGTMDSRLPGIAFLQAQVLRDHGEFDSALKLISPLLFEHPVSIDLEFFYIHLMARQGCQREALEYLNALGDCVKISSLPHLQQFEYFWLEMYILTSLGEFSKSLAVGPILEKLAETDSHLQARYTMQMGRIYDFRGAVLKAIEYYDTSIAYFDGTHYIIDYIDTLHNLSNIYQYQGRYTNAVNGYLKEIDYLQQLGNNYYEALTKSDLGWSYFLQGNDALALQYLHEAEEYFAEFETSKNIVDRCEVLAKFIITLAYNHSLEEANRYMVILLAFKADLHPQVLVYQQAARATLLRSSNMFESIADAMKLFRQIARRRPVIDIEYALYGYLSLIDINFRNYSYAANPVILGELNTLVEELACFAKEQNSVSIELQANWTKAKLLLLRGNRKEAIQLMTQVLAKSERLKFDSIASQAQNDLDHIDEPLGEAIDQTDFSYFRHDLTRQMLFSGQVQGTEDPQVFFIMGSNGIPLFSYHFINDASLVHENMIGTFVAAIEAFGSEALLHSDPLLTIQFKEYKILLEKANGLSFVFVIKGQTYPAHRKLLDFIRNFQLSTISDELTAYTVQISSATIDELERIFQLVFTY